MNTPTLNTLDSQDATDETIITTSSTITEILTSFDDYDLPNSIVDRLAERGITIPTAVQAQTMRQVRSGQNLIVQAKTGTGKTFAFGLPLLAALEAPAGKRARVLVVTPTRELCLQIHRDLSELGALIGLRVTAVYGGQDPKGQINQLKAGVDIVVGTPGRLLDLANQKELHLDEVVHIVLDEADEMLDMGFLPDVTKLMSMTSNRQQTLLFSATMAAPILQLARRFMTNPYFIQVEDPNSTGATVSNVTQHLYQTHPLDKPEVLARILQADGRGPAIVFCRTKRGAQKVADDMVERGFKAAPIHGDLGQGAREKALADFRAMKVDVLVATDVAARGIDITGVTHVINYNAPEDAATYLHRIGRTARAGLSGNAVTFVDWDQLARWGFIAKDLALDLGEPVETFSTSAHLYTDMNITQGTGGRLRPAVPQPRREGTTRPTTTSSRSSRNNRAGVGTEQSKTDRPRRERRRTGGSRPRTDGSTTEHPVTERPVTGRPVTERSRTESPQATNRQAPDQPRTRNTPDEAGTPARRRQRRRRSSAA